MADAPRLARQMQPQHRQPRGCNPSKLGAAVAASRSASQAHVVTASQARGTRVLGPQRIKHRPRRQFSGQHGGREVRFTRHHASRQVGNDHRRDLERRRKVSPQPRPSSLFEAVRSGGLFVFEIGPSDLYIVNKAGASEKVRNLEGKMCNKKKAIRYAVRHHLT